jgi:hypothetical protein
MARIAAEKSEFYQGSTASAGTGCVYRKCASPRLHHAFDDHTRCHKKCIKRPLVIGDLAKQVLKQQTAYLTNKAEGLVENLDSNITESFGAMVSLFFGARRTNLQGRGVPKRQATLAGLTMSRGYKWHANAQRAMVHHPSKVLDNFAEYIDGRRKRAKANKKRRSRKRLAGRPNSDYQEESRDELLPSELEILVAE